MNPLSDDQLYGRPITFMGAPFGHDLRAAGAAILGVPFDCGIHPFRIGSRQGPQAMREQSALVRPYNSELADFNPVERLGLVDCGNVRLTPSRISDAFARIEEAAWRIHAGGAAPIAFGGDGSISVPLLRAAARRYPDLAALHIDSHTDAYAYDPNDKYNAATQFTHAAEENLIDTSISYHVGIRGTTYTSGVFAQAKSLGYNIITLREVFARGLSDVLDELHERIGARPVYLCWDMDVFDPSCAPGVCSPAWGGFSAREGIELLRGLSGLNIVAADVNTVSPPHDVNGMTAFLAAHVAYEMLVLLCAIRN